MFFIARLCNLPMIQFSGFINGLANSNGSDLATIMLQQEAASADKINILIAVMSVVAFISILALIVFVWLYYSWKGAYN